MKEKDLINAKDKKIKLKKKERKKVERLYDAMCAWNDPLHKNMEKNMMINMPIYH